VGRERFGGSVSTGNTHPSERHEAANANDAGSCFSGLHQNRMLNRIPRTTASSLELIPELIHCASKVSCVWGVIAML
jgi:hypothetical protein